MSQAVDNHWSTGTLPWRGMMRPRIGRHAEGFSMSQPQVHHPVVVEHAEQRAQDVQLRVADAITKFAGSMMFVYLHIVLFALWMLFIENSPWQKLTLIVSLEAIFLSTFVMIGQNRQSSFQQAKADHDFLAQELELKHNTEVTDAIHELAKAIHATVCTPR
jgi:uncharacterized membrane protein